MCRKAWQLGRARSATHTLLSSQTRVGFSQRCSYWRLSSHGQAGEIDRTIRAEMKLENVSRVRSAYSRFDGTMSILLERLYNRDEYRTNAENEIGRTRSAFGVLGTRCLLVHIRALMERQQPLRWPRSTRRCSLLDDQILPFLSHRG